MPRRRYVLHGGEERVTNPAKQVEGVQRVDAIHETDTVEITASLSDRLLNRFTRLVDNLLPE